MVEGNGHSGRGHVLFLWSPGGYRLSERDGEPPAIGSELEDGGREPVDEALRLRAESSAREGRRVQKDAGGPVQRRLVV